MTTSARVLIIDDDENIRKAGSRLLRSFGYEVRLAADGREGLDILETERIEVALVDITMPRMSGTEVLRRAARSAPNTVCIVVTGDAKVDVGNECLELGAFDFLEKPYGRARDFEHKIRRAVDVALLRWENDQARHDDPAESLLIGNSAAMAQVRHKIRRFAQTTGTVQIRGESGTGKELVAKALHRMSGRSGRFVGQNCAAFAQGLEEDHLFGHVKGGFTGAIGSYEGMFGAAAGGTVLLDEIGDMPMPLQIKLLRVLEDKEYFAVGSMESLPMTARVLTATHQNLEQKVEDGTFRKDLFYRLNVMTITLPPLRERREDIRPLAYRFVKDINKLENQGVEYIAPEAMELLERAPWPGNVRQLYNQIHNAAVIAEGETITAEDVLQGSQPLEAAPTDILTDEALLSMGWNEAKERVLEAFAHMYLSEQLRRSGGNITDAAERSGMQRPNFSRLMRRFDVPLVS